MKSMLALIFSLFCAPAQSATIYQQWDDGLALQTVIGVNDYSTVTSFPDGKPYVSVDMYRNDYNNGRTAVFSPLQELTVSSGTAGGYVTPFWMDFDFRFRAGTGSSVFVGLFNIDGDNDNDPAINLLGIQLSGASISVRKYTNAGPASSATLNGAGTDVLHRVKTHVYNEDGKTKMDVRLYVIDEKTFEITLLESLEGYVVLYSGGEFQQGMDSLGVRNMFFENPDLDIHAEVDIDNIYYSTSEPNRQSPVPSFAPLCVSAVVYAAGGGDPQGDTFDPWNTSRWANWYSDKGVLTNSFLIDCDVTMVPDHGAGNPWVPAVSSELAENGEIFTFGNFSQGIVFNGNGNVIDLLPSRSTDTLFNIYNDPDIDLDSQFPMVRCFYSSMDMDSSAGRPTVIKHIEIRHFLQGIRTAASQAYPLEIINSTLTLNNFGLYLGGDHVLVQNCAINNNRYGGIYLDKASESIVCSNNFQDNNYAQTMWFGDIVVDSSHLNDIVNNNHLLPSDGVFHVAVRCYRNMGEFDQLRQNPAGYNVFSNNMINGYTIGYDVASRMGIDRSDKDLSNEARDYAQGNLFKNNSISNTAFGIKINCSGNEINGNEFDNVTFPILLHPVFFSLTETHIANQDGTKVSYWFNNSDVADNSVIGFPRLTDRNQGMDEADRYVHISYSGSPDFDSYSGPATLVKKSGSNASQIIDPSTMQDVYKQAGPPRDMAVGDFWPETPGEEIAVIWDVPVSMVDGTNYYSIIFYDSDGMEINRSGRSLTEWRSIAAGNFISLYGDEVAAVPNSPVNGAYPIFIFGRGREVASSTNLLGNTSQIYDIAAGNFAADWYDEIAYVKSDTKNIIDFCKPDSTWTNRTETLWILDMAAGNFDGDSDNGDEIAIIRGTTAKIYFYRAGDTDLYDTSGLYSSGNQELTKIAGGNFGGEAFADEVAVVSATAVNGEYPVWCYYPGETDPFKEISQNVLGVVAKAVDSITIPINSDLGEYERAQGFSSSDYGAAIANWGESVIVLPAIPQTNAIPAFILNADSADSSKEYVKVVPLVK